MPFIDAPTDPLTLPRMPEGITPTAPKTPGFVDTVAAAFRQDSPVVNLMRNSYEETFPSEPDHNPIDMIRGTDYEAMHADKFVRSKSSNETRSIMRKIDEENADRQTLAASGVAGFVAQIAAGTLDPTIAIPGVIAVRSIKGGYSVARTMLATSAATAGGIAAQEAALQATQETRTAGESAIAIGSGAIIGGIIGSGAAALLSRAERSALERAFDADRLLMNAHASGMPTPAPAGAAVADTRQLELELSIPGTSRISPTRRTMEAEAVEARRIMADLAETPYRFKENVEGVATTQGPAVDRLARMQMDGLRTQVGDELDRAFAEYRFGAADTSVPRLRSRIQGLIGNAEGKMSMTDFKREVSVALQSGDQHQIPQVAQTAQFIRNKLLNPWAERAENVLDGFERITPSEGEAYFPHIWNKEKIKAQRPEFVNRLTDLYKTDQTTKRAIQQRLEFSAAQLRSWDEQIDKLEARFGRAEERAKRIEARAGERARDDLPQTVGMNEPDATGRTAELQIRKAALEAEAKDLADLADLAEDLVRTNPQLAPALNRTLAALEAKGRRIDITGALHAEAGRGAKRSEARLATLQEQLGKTEARQGLIEDYLMVAGNFRDQVRAKIEADIGAWEGKSAAEAKAAIKAREKYEQETGRVFGPKEGEGRLTAADSAIDRTVKRILASDREISDAELRARAHETVQRIIGSPDGRLPYDMHMGGPRIGVSDGSPPPRGSLAERQLNVSNAWARDWLEDDIETVVAMHLRTVIPDVLLAERFGDVEMSNAFRQINESYAKLIDATQAGKKRDQLTAEHKSVVRDMAAVRDRIRGVYGWSADTANMARIANAAKNLNSMTSMGVAAVSSLPDMAGVVFRHGMVAAFADGWVPFFRGMRSTDEGWAKFKTQMRAMGIGVETSINSRQHALDDVVDVYRPQSRFERTLQGATDKFFILNMLAPFTDMTKLVAAHTAVSEFLRAVKAVTAGTATKRQITNLAEGNIDAQMASRIWREFGELKRGEVIDGVHLPNTADWGDQGAALALNGAIARDVNIAVVTPGQEKPLFMSKPVVSLLTQFKSFTAAATERVLIANLQRRDAAVLQGLVFSIGLGMMSYKINSLLGGKDTSDRPQDWIKEGISRGGILGWLEDGNALASKATRGSADIYRLIGADKPLSRFASRSAADMLLGPTWGKIEAIPKITGAAASGEWSAADTSAVRRLIPLQNLFYLRGLLNQVEAGANNAFGVPERKEPARH